MLSETLLLFAGASGAGAVALVLVANRRDALARQSDSADVDVTDAGDAVPSTSGAVPGPVVGGASDGVAAQWEGDRGPDRAESSGEPDGPGEDGDPDVGVDVIDVEVEDQLRDVQVLSPEDRDARMGEPDAVEVDPVTVGTPVVARGERSRVSVGGGHGGFHLPGSVRRQRRRWASAHGHDYSRGDAFLGDEWNGGPAGAGVTAKDVVSGMTSGHEFHLADLGPETVLAFRRVTGSAVVVQMTRSAEDRDSVLRLGDFAVFCAEPDVAGRFVDERVSAALDALPAAVTAVWTESRWVIAQLVRRSSPEDWDAALEPLALLADSACTLPPRDGDTPLRDVEGLDPSRPLPAPHRSTDRSGGVAEDGSEPVVRPLVQRPDEPVELPSRFRSEQRGTVEPRAVGGDEIDAIADGGDVDPRPGGVRVPRTFRTGPSIFTDSDTDTGAAASAPETDDPTATEEP
ncbi:hypothetical protein [Corynebacterium pygosceleis]|uniref:hypothetical protein n=1 Tax=Corynebacterium pygosceleis TaxID=2800406 RepID=UPI002005CF20|nr:hypothetical protein [Corynebacterium pygosceleis]MCK7675317.1 hypothetical protein [Corynebacterium pygosceleis]